MLYRTFSTAIPFFQIALVLAVFQVEPAKAVITFTGEISPSGPGDGDLEETLEVGLGDPFSVNPLATVIVADESLEFDEAYIGSDDGFFGRLFVSGALGRFNVESSASNSDPALQVGRDGNGYLEVSTQAILELESASGDAVIGDRNTSFGHMVVKDSFSFASVGENLTIGEEGVGQLDILSGAIVRTRDTSSASVTIGNLANSVGTVNVDGAGSVLQPADDLRVGGAGVATLNITNGGLVDSDNSGNVTSVGTLGRIYLNEGTLSVDTLNLDGVLSGHGLVRGDGSGSGLVNASVGSRIETGAGQLLQFNDDVSNQGTINIEGGEIEFLDGLTNNATGGSTAPGRITLEDGRVRFTQALANNGVLAVAEGASDLHGAIANNAGAAVTIARDAVATFHDPFTDNGGTLTILAGGNALFLADLSFQASSTLTLEIETATSGGSALSVSGTAALAGELQVTLPEDFNPEAGQTITLLEADAITGAFIPPLFPTLEGGLELELQASSTSVQLAVIDPGLPGDFNGDGVVDAADYTVWRDSLGSIDDYNLWVANFGQTASSSSSGSNTVPEPTSWLLITLATCAIVCRRH